MKHLSTGLCVLIVFLSLPVFADEVLDNANQAMDLYKQGKYAEAANYFEFAGQLSRKKRSGSLSDHLPDALKGWTAKEVTAQAVGSAMFGGMTTAQRDYHKDKSRIKITIIADSPMIQSVSMILKNPMLAMSSGGELIMLNGEKAFLKFEGDRQKGQMQIVVDNQFMITVDGNHVTREDILNYAQAIDVKGLASEKE